MGSGTIQEAAPRAGALRVVEIDPHADPRFEAFVAAHPGALAYHHPAWLRVLDREYHRPGVHLACENSAGELCGVLSLLETRGIPLRRGHRSSRRLSSLPRTPIGGPLTLDREAAEALVRAAIERTEARPGMLLELKLPGREPGVAVAGVDCVPWRLTYRLELPERPDELRFGNARNHARIAWSVRRAERLGIRLREAETLADVRAWYPLYLQVMRARVVPPRPLRFFEAAWDELAPRGLMRLLLGERRGPGRSRLMSGSLFLTLGHTTVYAFEGRSRDESRFRSTDLVMNGAIRAAAAEGHRVFDLGEVAAGQAGLAAFKSKWGSAPELLHRLYYPPPARLESGAVKPGGPVLRLARATWHRTPLGLTQAVGDRVYSRM